MNEEYINFGDELVNKQDLLKAINDYKAYSSTQPWSASRRGAFDAAVESAINRGILGTRKYTNPDTGESVYYATFGGDPFDINTFDKNTRRGYMDAASFIGRLAESLPTKKSIEEKQKKEEEEKLAKLQKFDNFENSFKNYMKQYLGGQEFNIGSNNGKEDKWNYLDDVRDENGAVGIENRTKELSKRLKEYKTNLKVENYNWKDTPYGSSEEFLKRLDKAITALDSPGFEDDHDAIEQLGLPYNQWFNNRTGEIYGEDKAGNPVTYGAYYRALQEQKDTEAKVADDKQKLSQKQAYDNQLFLSRVTSPKMQGWNPVALKEKYKDSNSLLAALQNYAQRDIKTLTPDEQSELHGAYRNLANQPIDSKLFNKIKNSSSGLYRNSAPNRFKKINGIDNLIWDSVAKQVIQINSRKQLEALQNQPQDLFAGIQTQQEKQTVPKGQGIELTDADKRDIYATLADLGALINPGIFTGTAMALSASGARTWNSIEEKGLWDTLTDWKTWADWGTGALGGTMLLGDASSAVKVVRGLGKLMTIPMVWNSLTSIPEAKAAWDKIDLSSPIESAKKLTPQDYHALSTFLMGIVSGKNYLRGNLAERQVLKQSGINIESKSKIREYSNKFGLTRTKPQDQKTVSTLKVKKTGEDGKVDEKVVELNEKQRTAIQKAKASEIEKVAKDEGVEIPEGYKVEVNKSKINSVRSYYQRPLGRANSEVIGKQTQTASRGKDNFETWLQDRSIWNKWKYGSNKNLRRIRENLGIKPIQQENSETPSTTPKTETSTSKSIENKQQTQVPRSRNEIRRDWKNTIERKQFSTNDIKSGEYNITNPKDSKFNVNFKVSDKDSEGFRTLIINGSNPVKIKTQKQLQEKIAQAIKSYRNTVNNSRNKAGINHKEVGRILRELKAKGWLKHGGTLTLDETINNFLKNNNI